MPAPIASTFFNAPAISQPMTSGFVYTRKLGEKNSCCRLSATAVVAHRNDRSRRLPGRDLTRQVRTGQHTDTRPVVLGEHLARHLGHARERALLDALGETHDAAPCDR